ncbi:MAG TPA: acyl-CoA dehydrogenase family protein [Saprospiraceae bacterium]|nr:acyl-CoA dehydrogenase family protein [Saprospiraceae bacterium]
MNFNIYSDENLKVIEGSIADFTKKYIEPNYKDWDEAQVFPVNTMHLLGEYGFLGAVIPEMYGGSGLSYQAYVSILQEISKVCGSIGLSVAAHNSLCTNHLYMFGNEEQRLKYLPDLASGRWIGAWGLTEPNTGSDAMRMKCVGEKDGDYYIINGSKSWITHGKSGDVAVVLVRTGDLLDSRGISAFIIEKGTPGFKPGKKENKLGMRSSETAPLHFDNCRVHKSQLLGNEGEGFIQAMQVLDGGRISIAAVGLGIAKGAYEASVAYANQREQFGKPISSFQAIAFKLADMATKIETAELLTRKAAWLKDSGQPFTKIAAMAKYKASEISVEISTDAIQIFGGYGYTKDYPVEKFYRDSKLLTIGEGTSEIQKLVISRHLIK